MQIPISVERVRELLHYCPITGEFLWKSYRNPQAIEGQRAGHISNTGGYLVIGIDNKVMQAHRLAWLHYFGAWPTEQIDHINHNKLDNRISNLREVSQRQNLHNKSKSKANSSGNTGVYKTNTGKWIARICVNRQQINLGTFSNFNDAVLARQNANKLHNFHSNHGY